MGDHDKELALLIHRELNARGPRRRRGEPDPEDIERRRKRKEEDEESSEDGSGGGSGSGSEQQQEGDETSKEPTPKRQRMDPEQRIAYAAAQQTIENPTTANNKKQSRKTNNNTKTTATATADLPPHVKCFATGLPWGVLLPRQTLQTPSSLWEALLLAYGADSIIASKTMTGGVLVSTDGSAVVVECQDSVEMWSRAAESVVRMYVNFEKEKDKEEGKVVAVEVLDSQAVKKEEKDEDKVGLPRGEKDVAAVVDVAPAAAVKEKVENAAKIV